MEEEDLVSLERVLLQPSLSFHLPPVVKEHSPPSISGESLCGHPRLARRTRKVAGGRVLRREVEDSQGVLQGQRCETSPAQVEALQGPQKDGQGSRCYRRRCPSSPSGTSRPVEGTRLHLKRRVQLHN